MNKRIILIFYIITLILFSNSFGQTIRKQSPDYIIQKKNGKIILAYKVFDDFLKSDRSWENYQVNFLKAIPDVQLVHNQQLDWKIIDSAKFPEVLKNYKREDFEKYFTQYDEKFINNLYDSVIEKAHTILPPITDKPVDLCLFLPYRGCFVIPEKDKNTIFISLLINPRDVRKIMAHEYAHCLHIQRRPVEPLTLRREVVSEGMAVYLTTLIDKNLGLKNAIPFMPESSVEWCMEHEQQIKDSIQVELEDSGQQIFFRYISDGGIAAPPKGFVQKTAYYIGYKIIKACIDKGMKLEEICSLDSKAVIERSRYFTFK